MELLLTPWMTTISLMVSEKFHSESMESSTSSGMNTKAFIEQTCSLYKEAQTNKLV